MISLAPALPKALRNNGCAPATSNVSASGTPFQRWYNFKEAFSPGFVEETVLSSPVPVRRCLDPFGGSGTTALTCQFLGIHATTIEVSPFLGDLIEAKLSTYDVKRLREDWGAVWARVHGRGHAADPQEHFRNAPATFVEPGRQGRWIFDLQVAARIASYCGAIASLDSEVNRRLFRVLLGSILTSVSNVYISGKGRRYRRNWQESRMPAQEVDKLMSMAVQNAVYDICRYGLRKAQDYSLLRGDSRVLVQEASSVDLVLFSPPYPNSFDYTDIYNVELWSLGYLDSPEANRSLREATLRSHVQIRRQFSEDSLGSPTLAETLERLSGSSEVLWDNNIPGMVAAYFADLAKILGDCRRVLSAGGQIVMVVGDSSYAGILVNVPQITEELLPSLELQCIERRAVRSMRNSPQHGGSFVLSESLLRFAAS